MAKERPHTAKITTNAADLKSATLRRGVINKRPVATQQPTRVNKSRDKPDAATILVTLREK
ncbi:hypothetical protein D3C80_940910 [compost metagenome]